MQAGAALTTSFPQRIGISLLLAPSGLTPNGSTMFGFGAAALNAAGGGLCR
jgi:hypothetical protein